MKTLNKKSYLGVSGDTFPGHPSTSERVQERVGNGSMNGSTNELGTCPRTVWERVHEVVPKVYCWQFILMNIGTFPVHMVGEGGGSSVDTSGWTSQHSGTPPLRRERKTFSAFVFGRPRRARCKQSPVGLAVSGFGRFSSVALRRENHSQHSSSVELDHGGQNRTAVSTAWRGGGNASIGNFDTPVRAGSRQNSWKLVSGWVRPRCMGATCDLP